MNLILKLAKSILQDLSTVAAVLADGKVSVTEALVMKWKGVTRPLNLKALVPESIDELKSFPQFEDLTEDDVLVITDGKPVAEKFVKQAYDIALAQYSLVADLIEEDENATIKLPDILPDVDLTKVPGIGDATRETLETLGIKTVKQLAEADVDKLKEAFKTAGKSNPIIAKVGSFIDAAKKLLEQVA